MSNMDSISEEVIELDSIEPDTLEKKHYLLINYTGDGYHWGCYATSHAITRKILENGSLEIISVAQNGQFKLGNVAFALEHADAPTFSKQHPAIAEKIKNADVVVVNGEGTLHGEFTAGPIALLSMIRFAKAASKTVHLINHSCFPSDSTARSPADAVYSVILREVDKVVVRDIASLDFYKRNGISAVLGFDCLPLYYHETCVDAPARTASREYITVIGGVTMSVAQVAEIIDLLLLRYGKKYTITYLYGSAGGLTKEDKIAEDDFGQRYISESRFELANAKSFPEYMSHIKGSRLLITGRFHYAVAAMSSDTPFIAYKSNTPKTETVVSAHGYDANVLDPDAPIAENLKAVLDNFDQGNATLKCVSSLAELVTLANRNFEGMFDTRAATASNTPEEIIVSLAKDGQYRVLADYWATVTDATISLASRVKVARSLNISKRYAESLEQCELILGHQPSARGVIITKMNCLIAMGLDEEAKAVARSAIKRFPEASGILASAASILNKAGDLKAAANAAEQALDINSTNKTALLIATRYYLTVVGNYARATQLLRRYLSVDPQSPIANVQLGIALAQTGIDGEAFDHLAYRNDMPIVKLRHREADYQLPKWDGTPISGRLLVRPEPENGVGYEALCATFIPELHRIGQAFSFAIQPRFRPYFQSVFPNDDFVDIGNELSGRTYEAEVHFRDLCKLRRRTREDFAYSRSHFSPLIPNRGISRKLRIGLSWHTSSIVPNQTMKRSIPLRNLLPLFQVKPERFQWVNLQYGAVDQEIEIAEAELDISIEHKAGCDFVKDNAALTAAIDSVDVIVSIDNSTVFFAGLKRKPTLLMAPFISHWIWGAPDVTSRWFPSVEIIRQPSWGDWDTVMRNVAISLESMVDRTR